MTFTIYLVKNYIFSESKEDFQVWNFIVLDSIFCTWKRV